MEILESKESSGGEGFNYTQATQETFTQLLDNSQSQFSPVTPRTRPTPQQPQLFGKLINSHGTIEMEPRGLEALDTSDTAAIGSMSYMGKWKLPPADQRFNEYVFGRSVKGTDYCIKPPVLDNKPKLLGAHNLISNKHCRIYTIVSNSKSGSPNYIPVATNWIEDTSGNGTFVNGQRMGKGTKRALHSGDTVSFLHPNPDRLLNLITKEDIDDGNLTPNDLAVMITKYYTYTFIDLSNNLTPSARKPAVNVRQICPSQSLNHQEESLEKKAQRELFGKLADEYDIKEILGKGTCGEVRRAVHRENGRVYAIKTIPQLKLSSSNSSAMANSKLLQEAKLLSSLDHPYIVKLSNYSVSQRAINLVMEYVDGGDLFDAIVSKGHFSEPLSKKIFRRLLSAVHYLHSKNIVHRDLKPENILVKNLDNSSINKGGEFAVKVTDFGLAKITDSRGLKTFCGTPQYFAPEVLSRRFTVQGLGRYHKEADCWSLGVILYILLSGAPPFEAEDMEKITDDDFEVDFSDSVWRNVSFEARDLILRLLEKDVSCRFNISQAVDHPWFTLNDNGDSHKHPLDDPAVIHTTVAKQQHHEKKSTSRKRSLEIVQNFDSRTKVSTEEELSDISDCEYTCETVHFPRSPPGFNDVQKAAKAQRLVGKESEKENNTSNGFNVPMTNQGGNSNKKNQEVSMHVDRNTKNNQSTLSSFIIRRGKK